MPNTATSTATTKRSAGAGEGEPPAKRLRNGIFPSPSWSDLRPELISHIARYLPMGTPDMMRLLLCVGPRVAAVVRKMYLTGNDYYLSCYMEAHLSKEVPRSRLQQVVGYWMDYNEEAWKKRCLGKAHEQNLHAFSFQFEKLERRALQRDGDYIYCKGEYVYNAFSDYHDVDALEKVAKNSGDLLIVSRGNEDVDEDIAKALPFYSLVKSRRTNKGKGKASLRFMRRVDAIFAYPKYVIGYGLVDVLKFMIEERIIEPSMTISSLDSDAMAIVKKESLLHFAMESDAINCFRYLLSLFGTDANAVALSFHDEEGPEDQYHFLHSYLRNEEKSLSFLEALLGRGDIDVNRQDMFTFTPIYAACLFGDFRESSREQAMATIRMLLEAGADPRTENDSGRTPMSYLESQARMAVEDQNFKLAADLRTLNEEIGRFVQKLDERDWQNMLF